MYLDCNNTYYIDYLSNNIEEIEFGYHFNLELNNLPSSIKTMLFNNDYYDKKLNNLPQGLELLRLPSDYNLPIENIPKELKKIICGIFYKYQKDFKNIKIEYY